MDIAGHKISGWWIVGGGVGLVVAYVFYKHMSASASSASGSASSSSAIDPVTGLPYSQDNQIDPMTGLTYLAEAQQYGSVQAAEEQVTSGAAYYGQTGTSGVDDSGYPTYTATGTATTGTTYSTNAQWAQAVTAGLTDLGYNSTDVSAALGLYFQSQPLGSGSDGVSYLSIVQAAIAEFGPPPVGTFPVIGSTGTGTGTGKGSGTAPEAVTGLTITPRSHTAIVASWKPSSGATSYSFQITPKDTASHNIGERTSYDVGGLKKKTPYVVHVAAVNSAGSSAYATASYTTK